MLVVRQNATHKVLIGPVVAVGDGFTPVTTLALGTADEAEAILHDNGTVVSISAYTFAAITSADGYYHLTLQSGITSTIGHMTVVINDDSLCLPVKADFTVVEESVYDNVFASGAVGPLTAAQVNTEADTAISDAALATAAVCTEARLAELDAGNLPLTTDNILTDTGTTLEAHFTDIKGTSFIKDTHSLIDIATDTAEIGAAGAGLTAINLPDQTMDITGNLSGSVGSVTGAVGSVTGAVGSVTGHTAQTGDTYAIANGAAGFVAIDTVVDAVKVITDALGATAAANLALSAGQIITGTVSNAVLTPTTTAFAADDITEATADHYNGRIVIFTSGALAGQATDITDYSLVSSEGNFTVTAMTEAPANNDTFIIV